MTLHDVVVDYILNSAYSGTAKILAARPPRYSSASSGAGGEGADTSAAGSARSSARSTPSPEERMDVDVAAGDEGAALSSKSSTSSAPRLDDAVLASIEQRRAIIDYILSGAVVRAVDALHTHFPAVLAPAVRNGGGSGSATWGAVASNGVSSNGAGTNGASSTSAYVLTPRPGMGGGAAPRGASGSGGSGSPGPTDHATPVFVRSADPDHVRLNLQIQQFIESFKQLAPSTESSPSSPANSIESLGGSAGGMSGSLTGSKELTNALAALQALHTDATRLTPDHRAVYLQEIKDVGALFAYTDPENSILKGFLDQARRSALAAQINAAILKSEGRPVRSHLEEVVRRTHAIYATITEQGIDPQPSWTGDGGKGAGGGAGHWRIAEQLKRRPFQKGGFDLHEYVWESP